MVIQGTRLIEQIIVLTQRGYASTAAVVNDYAAQHGLINPTDHAALKTRIANSPQVALPAGHRLYGVFQDSVVSSLHFETLTDLGLAREAFRQAVRWIEIETSSQCNRRCSYCPNSKFDRISHNGFLDHQIYNRMMTDLATIDYDGEIKFVGNNEFFMHRQNRFYVDAARRMLPKAQMTLFSNGDYLTRDDLEWASAAGVRSLIITLHPGPTKRFDDAEVLRRAWAFQTKTQSTLQLRYLNPGKSLQFVSQCGPMTILIGSSNLQETGHNWTGLLPGDETYVRSDPCSYPLRQFVVNNAGDIFMCCIAFKERTAENRAIGAITGNLADFESVFHAYASPGLVAWRRSVFTNAVKEAPCRTCRGHADYREPEARDLADFVEKQILLPA